MENYKTRITVDLDTRDADSFVKLVQEAKWATDRFGGEFPNNFFVRFSRKKGFHAVLWLKRKISRSLEYEIRTYLGDDPKRIARDKAKKGLPRNVLFNADAGRIIWDG